MQAKYPQQYAIRAAEDKREREATAVETMTVHIDNKHRLIPNTPVWGNDRDWTFFVRPSRTDVILGVRINTASSFGRPFVTRLKPPYQIRRLGWGSFDIIVWIVLEKG